LTRYRSSIVVPNPREETFAFVSDFRNAAAWDPQVVRAWKDTPGPIGPWTRFVLVTRMLGREVELPYEVTDFEPGRRIVLAGATKHLTYRDVIQVEEVAGETHHGTRLGYDATLSLTGLLKPGNLVLRYLLTRIGDDALEGIRRGLGELMEEGGPEHPTPPPLAAIGPEAVRAIAAMHDRPVLRNLRITQGYHLLSERLAGMLGRGDLNWCTYATWASKTAGAFIRGDELRAAVRAVLHRRGLRRKLAKLRRALSAVAPEAAEALSEERVTALVEQVIAEVGAWVRGGNEIVFAELGALYADFVATFEGDAAPDAAKLDAFLATLAPGDAEPDAVTGIAVDGPLRFEQRGGQGLLRAAMRTYHAALFETDPKRKSELILAGSALGGLHEQYRLQTYIAGALGTPVAETLYSRGNDALAERVKRDKLGAAQVVLHRLFTPVGEEIAETAREVSTLFLMEQQTPGETLQLGTDLPAPRSGPLFPPHLTALADPELVALLERFGAYGRLAGAKGPKAKARRLLLRALVALRLYRPTAFGSAAADWGDLGERMRYIFVYFRSRQASADLFQPPFSSEQAAAIEAGHVPPGPL
jgi:hypothetical protein